MSVPDQGSIISSAVAVAIGTGAGYKQGRDFDTWPVAKQEATGDRTVVGKIPKRGNKCLWASFVQTALSALAAWGRAGAVPMNRGCWAEAAPKPAGDRAVQQDGPHCLGGVPKGIHISRGAPLIQH